MVLLKRLDVGMECLLWENQCGFRRNRSCTCIDQIYSIRTIIHNCIEFNIPLYVNLIDFKAAFESTRRQFFWSSMRHYGLSEKYFRIFRAFFNGTMSAVRVKCLIGSLSIQALDRVIFRALLYLIFVLTLESFWPSFTRL